MSKIDHHSQMVSNKLLLLIITGILFATGTFFAAFITSQKAATPHPKAGLKLVVPSLPPFPSLPLRTKNFIPAEAPLPFEPQITDDDQTQTIEADLTGTDTAEPTQDLNSLDKDLNQL